MRTIAIETERLILRQLAETDADFILRLLNDPAWLRFIGDKNVRSLDDARAYIRQGPQRMYAQEGFGLWLVAPRQGNGALGLCGLIRRDTLDDVDIGFAFLPGFRGLGYALEAATAVRDHARDALGLVRLVAIASPDNDRSIRLLERLGFRFERTLCLTGDADPVSLFGCDLRPQALSAGEEGGSAGVGAGQSRPPFQ